MPHDLDRLLPIARSMARRQSRRLGLDPDDCESAACYACWRAWESYRPGRGPLTGWVAYKIRHALADHVRVVLGLRRKAPPPRRHDLDDTARLDCRGNEVSYLDLAAVTDDPHTDEGFHRLPGDAAVQGAASAGTGVRLWSTPPGGSGASGSDQVAAQPDPPDGTRAIAGAPAMRVIDGLTQAQRRVLMYLVGYSLEYGIPPTVRQVCRAFGWHSTNAATGHLDALVRKGYLLHEPDVSHAYRLAGVRLAVDDSEAGRRLREAMGEQP